MVFEFVLIAFVIMTREPGAALIGFPVLMILCTGSFFAWFYSLGTNLFKRLPVTEKMSLTRFRLFLFIPLVYMLFLMLFIFFDAFRGAELGPGIFALIIPLHLFSMFCMFYCLYFNAKVLKAVELQRPVTFNDYAGEFFLLWFFPIGVWFIQPRINRLFNVTPEDPGDSIPGGYYS